MYSDQMIVQISYWDLTELMQQLPDLHNDPNQGWSNFLEKNHFREFSRGQWGCKKKKHLLVLEAAALLFYQFMGTPLGYTQLGMDFRFKWDMIMMRDFLLYNFLSSYFILSIFIWYVIIIISYMHIDP